MASLAAGFETPSTSGPIPPPPKLVRQHNRLHWYSELLIHGYSVVTGYQAFDTDTVVNGEEVVCPAGSIILVRKDEPKPN